MSVRIFTLESSHALCLRGWTRAIADGHIHLHDPVTSYLVHNAIASSRVISLSDVHFDFPSSGNVPLIQRASRIFPYLLGHAGGANNYDILVS